jgi:hypothetical protein
MKFRSAAQRKAVMTQLRLGKKVEMEHHLGKKMATKIAIDHLKEDKSYYTKLKRCKL